MLQWRIERCAIFFFLGHRDVIRHPNRILTIALFAAFLAACSSPLSSTEPSTLLVTGSTPEHWTPPLQASWQVQYSGAIDLSLPVDIYNLDLFATSPDIIADLHARGVKVICRFSAGTLAPSSPDADAFPAAVLGFTSASRPDEQWLDIRNLQTLAPIMLERVALAAQKGCDGVDPDHVDGYANDSGFPLAPEDQLAYNVFLANAAHQNGLGVGLKNDLAQIPILLPYFDWAISEECFFYKECHLLQPFVSAGKPVFVIEYNLTPEEFCFQSIDLNFNAMQKKIELDAFRFPCR